MGGRATLVVRSVSRPELAEALRSAGEQTHDDVEVVVVDATGGRHAPVPDRTGRHPVVFVGGSQPRTRPIAAGVGFGRATGEYVGLLDDDDLLLPRHLELLVAELEEHPDAVLAFSRVREVRAGGPAVSIGHARYSRLMLLDACFFPPCAALVRRSVANQCRFDETLDAGEDWDFWLQAGTRGPFRFVDEETAVYRADRGRSAMTHGDVATADRWQARVREKWSKEREALTEEVDRCFHEAVACAGRGDVTRAHELASVVERLYPFHVGALNLRGSLRARHGDFAGAERDFAVAVEAAPDDPASRFNLGQAQERLGRLADAATCYRRVVALDPAFEPARARLASLPFHGSTS